MAASIEYSRELLLLLLGPYHGTQLTNRNLQKLRRKGLQSDPCLCELKDHPYAIQR